MIAHGLDPRDRAIIEGGAPYLDAAAVARRARAPIGLLGRDIVGWIAQPQPAGPSPSDPLEPTAATIRPLMPELAVIGTDRAGRAGAIRVAPQIAVTAATVLDGSALVELRDATATMWGLVLATDPASGLALVELPRPGPALPLDTSPVHLPLQPAALGTGLVRDEALVGVIIEPATGRAATAQAIAALLERAGLRP